MKICPCPWQPTSPYGKCPQKSCREKSLLPICCLVFKPQTTCYIDGAMGWKKASKSSPRKKLQWVVGVSAPPRRCPGAFRFFLRRCPSPVGIPFLRPRAMYMYIHTHIYIYTFCCFVPRAVCDLTGDERVGYRKKKEKVHQRMQTRYS